MLHVGPKGPNLPIVVVLHPETQSSITPLFPWVLFEIIE